jgi:hypothetical protein
MVRTSLQLSGKGRERVTSATAGRGTGRGHNSKRKSQQVGPSTAPIASEPTRGRRKGAKRKLQEDGGKHSYNHICKRKKHKRHFQHSLD